jgi:hypothetical protein
MQIPKGLLIGIFITASIGTWAESRAASGALPFDLRFDLSGGGCYAPSYGSGEDMLSAYGYSVDVGTEFLVNQWIPFRSELSYYSVDNSSWDSDLFRYRAFWGLRWAAEAGYRVELGTLELDLLAGGALSASRYTDLSVVTAYPSIVGEARLLVPLAIRSFPGLSISAGIPLEYMWRGTARTFSVGAEVGISVLLGQGRKKAAKL